MKSDLALVVNKEEVPKSYFQSKVEDIKNVIKNIKHNFVSLGAYLLDIKNNSELKSTFHWKKGRPCQDIYEFAEQEFNICKTTCKNLMGIVTRFATLHSVLKKEYEPYNYTQLSVMLPLSDSQLLLVNPDMSKAEINSLKKVGQPVDQKQPVEQHTIKEQWLTLKNDTQRLEFLNTYKDWECFDSVSFLGLKFFRCALDNGDYIITTEKDNKQSIYSIFGGNGSVASQWSSEPCRFDSYLFSGMCQTEYLTYMKSNKVRVRDYKGGKNENS